VPAREGAEAKASRLLADGHVTVLAAGRGFAVARIRGDNNQYVTAFRHARWSCTCINPGTCSHLLALRRITAPDLTEENTP
jgi:hypothetical protein